MSYVMNRLIRRSKYEDKFYTEVLIYYGHNNEMRYKKVALKTFYSSVKPGVKHNYSLLGKSLKKVPGLSG
jgi:hypothetical protein